MLVLVFFFFKQKTAYEMLRSLVGSEMCIRDSRDDLPGAQAGAPRRLEVRDPVQRQQRMAIGVLALSLIHI